MAEDAKGQPLKKEADRLSMDDFPEFTNWSLDEMEAFVENRPTTEDVQGYLAQAHRVVALSSHFAADQPGSACCGYLSLNPMTEENVAKAMEIARKAGWTPDGGWPRG